LATLVMVIRRCTDHATGKTSDEVRYYISSLPAKVRRLAGAVRQHWGIENGLHWVLDVAFNEDRMRQRDRNGIEKLGAAESPGGVASCVRTRASRRVSNANAKTGRLEWVPSQKGEPRAACMAIVGRSRDVPQRKDPPCVFRLHSQQGPTVPPPDQNPGADPRSPSLPSNNSGPSNSPGTPPAFATLEPQIHLAFGKLADQLVASLLAHAVAQPPLADAAQKKVAQAPPSPAPAPRHGRSPSACSAASSSTFSTLYCGARRPRHRQRARAGRGWPLPRALRLGDQRGFQPRPWSAWSAASAPCSRPTRLPSRKLAAARHAPGHQGRASHRPPPGRLGADVPQRRDPAPLGGAGPWWPAGAELAGRRVAAHDRWAGRTRVAHRDPQAEGPAAKAKSSAGVTRPSGASPSC